MDHTNIINDKTIKLTKWKISPSNVQSNNAISTNQINGIIHHVDRRDDRMTRIHLSQRERDHHLSSIKRKNRISSSVSSLNNIINDQEHHIRIDLRNSSSNIYVDSQIEKTFSLSTELENNNQSIDYKQRQSLHQFENLPELTRECSICLLDQPRNLFEECYSNQCKHIRRRICDICIYNYIKSIIENLQNTSIFCPEENCLTKFTFENIRYILNMGNNLELFERYDRQLTHQHLEQIKEFVWCAHNGCGSGQFHDMGFNSNPMLICIKCQKRTCAFHRLIWHVGMTCKQYDQSKMLSIDQKSQIWIKKYSKKCPKCGIFIEKISGCDHMTCQRCKYQFCWECFSDYQQIHIYGLRKHMTYCKHYPKTRPSNKICHTQRSRNCYIL